MKKTALSLITLILFFWPLVLSAMEQDGEYYQYSFARLSFVKGSVVLERAADLGSEEGVVNLAITEGDKLVVGDGRAEVHFGRKNYLRLDRGTEVEFSNLPRRDDDRTRLHLLIGRAYLRLNFLEEEKTFEVHTPDASFYILEEGLFRFDVKENRETELSVIEGSVEAAGETGSQLVSSRESLVASNGHLGSQGMISSRRDDFADWNDDRDALHRQYVSKRYLPSELEDYESELASNGYWAYERPFGYVWVPYIYYNDWRPYHYGRWVWYPLCGWSWVSYEPWGWCTYHYGRWHWRLGLGWYWIPHTHWGPAWVHWYWGYDYVGWCPLSWYNRPVVIVNNYFYDRYHSPYYPASSRALTVVHKNQLQNRDVSHVALSRVEASRLGQISLQAKAPDIKPVVNRANVQNVASGRISSSSPIRQFSKSPAVSGAGSPSRITRNPSSATGEKSPSSGGVVVNPRLSPSDRASRGGVSTFPSSGVEKRSASGSKGSQPSSERRIRSENSAPDRTTSFQSPPFSPRSGIKSYSPSTRTITPQKRSSSSSERRETSRVYSPDSSLSRFGASSWLSRSSEPRRETPGPGATRIREWSSSARSGKTRSEYHDSPWTFTVPSSPRLESSPSRSGSFSSPAPRSIFSAPRSSSPSRSPGFSSPPSTRSTPSFSSGSRSVGSSPRMSSPSGSSSPSRGSSSGRIARKGN